MNASHLLILAALFTSSLLAQTAPPIEWQKSLGGTETDVAETMQPTADGGFIVAGESDSNDGDVSGNHGDNDYWIVKLNAAGNIEWQRSYGGTGMDNAFAVQQVVDGGYIVAGKTFSNDGDVSGNHGASDYWILKLDAAGNIEWQKCLGGTGFEQANALQQVADGGYIVAGKSNSEDGDVSGNHGDYDYWVVKLDAGGNILWQKSLGGFQDDEATAVRQTADGGFIVAGNTDSNNGDVSGNHGMLDGWIVKLDATGNMEWQQCYGGLEDDLANAIELTADGGYIAAGSTRSFTGSIYADYYIVKLDAAGSSQWDKYFGGTAHDVIHSIHQNSDHGYILTGESSSADGDVTGNHGDKDAWTMKLDTAGAIQWTRSLGGSDTDIGSAILQTADEGWIAACYSRSNDGDVSGNHGHYDYWIVKIVPCSTTVIFYADVDSDGYGNAALTQTGPACTPPAGYVADTSDCNDNDAAIHPFATETCNIIDDNCNGSTDEGVLLTFYLDMDDDDYGNTDSITLACTPPAGYAALSEDCNDNDPNIHPGAPEIPNNGIDDNCNGETDEFGVGISGINNASISFSVFPNPTNGLLTIYLQLNKNLTVPSTIKVLNLLGQIIYEHKTQIIKGELTQEIQLSETGGIYLVKVTAGDQLFSARVTKN